MENNKQYSEAQMMIRKPAPEVFEAFVNPDITRHFWFTHGSDRLEKGKIITWHWEMYDLSTRVVVKEIIPDRKIIIDWDEPPVAVEFDFKTLSGDFTYVTIRHYIDKTGEELIRAIKDSTGGFTTVLDGCKAFLEHGIELKLIEDKFPKEDPLAFDSHRS